MENPIKRTPQTLLENMLVQSMAHSGRKRVKKKKKKKKRWKRK
jgi:hypothetical protein